MLYVDSETIKIHVREGSLVVFETLGGEQNAFYWTNDTYPEAFGPFDSVGEAMGHAAFIFKLDSKRKALLPSFVDNGKKAPEAPPAVTNDSFENVIYVDFFNKRRISK